MRRSTSREHARLENTQKETRCAQAGVALNEALKEGDQSEAKHVDAQPDMRLELLEKDVGGNFEQNVGDEENDEGVVVQGAVQSQFF